MSSSTSSVQGIFRELFTPLPEPQPSAPPYKDHADHVAHYANTTEGAWDLFRFIDCTLSWFKMLPSIPARLLDTITKVDNVANAAGIGLSIPKILVDGNTLRNSFTQLLGVQDLPYSDPLRDRKIAQAAKKSFLDAINFTFTLSQATLFLDNARIWVLDAAKSTVVNTVFNATSIISDGADLITECFNLERYQSSEAQPRSAAESAKLEEKKWLSWMNVIKDVASVAGAALALVGIVFGIATASVPIIIAGLALNTVWLTMKLASYFYNKIVVEAPLHRI